MAERLPERAGKRAEDVEVELIRARSLNLRKYVVMNGRYAGANGKCRLCKVDREELRKNPFAPGSGDSERRAAVGKVSDGANSRGHALFELRCDPLGLIDDQEPPRRETEGRTSFICNAAACTVRQRKAGDVPDSGDEFLFLTCPCGELDDGAGLRFGQNNSDASSRIAVGSRLPDRLEG